MRINSSDANSEPNTLQIANPAPKLSRRLREMCLKAQFASYHISSQTVQASIPIRLTISRIAGKIQPLRGISDGTSLADMPLRKGRVCHHDRSRAVTLGDSAREVLLPQWSKVFPQSDATRRCRRLARFRSQAAAAQPSRYLKSGTHHRAGSYRGSIQSDPRPRE